jgi:hypothetical protein
MVNSYTKFSFLEFQIVYLKAMEALILHKNVLMATYLQLLSFNHNYIFFFLGESTYIHLWLGFYFKHYD